jgi:hypothetical protein
VFIRLRQECPPKANAAVLTVRSELERQPAG